MAEQSLFPLLPFEASKDCSECDATTYLTYSGMTRDICPPRYDLMWFCSSCGFQKFAGSIRYPKKVLELQR